MYTCTHTHTHTYSLYEWHARDYVVCAGRDVKTALHYYDVRHYIPVSCYHPEILLSPFNERSSECETVSGDKKCDAYT